MIKDHEIFMGHLTLEEIKNELGQDEFTWYKEYMIEISNGKYKETSYFLTNRYLIEVKIEADSLIIRKFDIRTIDKIDKEFKIRFNNIILNNVTLYFKNGKNLVLKRPDEKENGHPKSFEKFVKLL